MQIIKFISLIMILASSSYIGFIISKKYSNRVKELKQMKQCLNSFSAKVKMTYQPIPQIFKEIGKKDLNSNINRIFVNASKNMENMSADNAWRTALEEQNTNLNKEDIESLKSLSNMLRRNRFRWTSKSNKIS